jgi:acyl-CoA thioesterase-1
LRVTLANPAVNGYTTDDLIDRELPDLATFHPTIVTLAIGANDYVRGQSVEHYRSQLQRILASIVTAGVASSHIVSLPQPDWSQSPAAASFGDPKRIFAAIRQFNGVLRDETAAVGGHYVDLFPLMQKEASAHWIAGDGLHPSAPALDAWSSELYTRISL